MGTQLPHGKGHSSPLFPAHIYVAKWLSISATAELLFIMLHMSNSPLSASTWLHNRNDVWSVEYLVQLSHKVFFWETVPGPAWSYNRAEGWLHKKLVSSNIADSLLMTYVSWSDAVILEWIMDRVAKTLSFFDLKSQPNVLVFPVSLIRTFKWKFVFHFHSYEFA